MTVSHSLVFMNLTVLKNTGQIYCRMALNLGLMLSYDETGVRSLGKNKEQS